MGQVVVIGLDIAKSVFQVHGVDRDGAVAVRRRLRRSRVLPFFATVEPCRIGIEACASGHYWARELGASGTMSGRWRRATWPVQLLARRTTKIAAVALANKTARIIWAIMTNGERYREPVGQAA